MPRHPQSAVGGPVNASEEPEANAPSTSAAAKGTFRFWHEERRFKGSGERCIVQQALFEHGGVRIGGYPKSAPVAGPLGWQRPGDWDFLWAPARLALKAIPHLKPGQLVSACPGLMSITKKRRLPATLKEALGEALAWDIVPHSFSLPEELPQLGAFVAEQTCNPATASGAAAASGTGGGGVSSGSGSDGEEQVPAAGARAGGAAGSASSSSTSGNTASTGAGAGSSSSGGGSGGADGNGRGKGQELWILKTAQHLGKGLKLMPLEAVALEAAKPRRRPGQKPYVLCQRYVERPLLVDGRKFGLRVWVAVTGHSPLRAYLHANGLVLFSTHGYDQSAWRTESGDVALGHVTNYAQNMDGTVWTLQQLESHMGAEAYGRMWSRVQRHSALVIAASLKHIKAEHEALKCPSGMTCEVVGLDYLIDVDLHPWLLEVNGTPSLQVEHEDGAVEQLIHDQKNGMVQDLMGLLGMRERFKPRYTALRAAAKAKQQAVAAAATATAAAGGSLAAAVASATAAVASAKPSAALTKKLREQMVPSTDEGVMARVAQELTHRGGFQPLMPLMPLEPGPGLNIPWDPRDFELRRLMTAAGVSFSSAAAAFYAQGGGDEAAAGGAAGAGAGGGSSSGVDAGAVARGGGSGSAGGSPEEPAAAGTGTGRAARRPAPGSRAAVGLGGSDDDDEEGGVGDDGDEDSEDDD
ncbi:hypothetical protein HXX76_008239 [Chlamydomonas incerta]|uniref:Tubulin--tyrosine ligase-like protein 5 n=1 Tax=Chlamydomonas incerta TaxID=51695 RepID=A0A835W2S1_CHLIN|nr:hypothetical protein HXX76_008239 [Chlamydomonas incerta]|eukprot:KAG2433886.1 hypothetical protein HXX76_008239 [Chlamydomonas incerta]